jgi:hypothetical protein
VKICNFLRQPITTSAIAMALLTFAISSSASASVTIAGQDYSQSELQNLLETPQCQGFIDYMKGQPTRGPNDSPHEASLKAHTLSLIVQDVSGNNVLNLNPNGRPEDLVKLFSISKTVTALQYGRLLKLANDGSFLGKNAFGVTTELSLDSSLVDLLPSLDYPAAHSLIQQKMTGSPTALHLISMASGIPWCEYVSCSSRDTLKMNYGRREDVVTAYIENLQTLPEGELTTPGVKYNYSAGNAVLLQAMMRTYLRSSYEETLKQEFFAPLGINNYRYERDGTGLYLGGSSLFMSGQDVAKIGQLFLNDGRLPDGSQFIDAEFIELLRQPNNYAASEETPAEIKIWEGPVGSSLWINRRLPGLAQFMPRVPESMYYGAGFYGQRLMMFPEHKTPEQQSFDGKGLGLVLTRLGAEPPIGPNRYSSHWNVTVEKFYQCFSNGDDILEIPEERKNLPSACSPPQLTTLNEEVDFTKEFALNLYPYQIEAIELCNCIYVQGHLTKKTVKRGRNTYQIADEDRTFEKCDQLYPMEWPEAVLPLMTPSRRWIHSRKSTVSVAGNPFQSHVGVDLGGGITNKRATAEYSSVTQSCSLKGRPPSFGFLGRQVLGPEAESAATSSFEETQHKMNLRLEEIRKQMKEQGIEGEPVQDGCFE